MPRVIAYSGLALIVAGVSWCGSMPTTLIAAGLALLVVGCNESARNRYLEHKAERDRLYGR